jgi:hypothetical protein
MKSHVFSLDFHRPVTAGLSTGITSQERFMKVPTLISLAAGEIEVPLRNLTPQR